MNTPEPSLSFDDTLNLSLQALIHERESLESCLEKYPQYAAELKPLLQTVLLTQRLKKPVMSAARVDALQERLMKAFPDAPTQHEDETPTLPVRRPVVIFPAWMGRSAAIVALILLATFGAGGGTVAASANSVPGETLYSIKRAWENLILLVASLIGRMDDMHLHLAHVRWEELQTLSQREQPIPDFAWQSFLQSFSVAYQEADAQAQRDLRRVLTDIEQSADQTVLPANYRADLLMILYQGDQALIPSATQEAAATPIIVLPAISTSTPIPTEDLIVLGTPTRLPIMVVDATATRTPTPSRTPTPTLTPSSTARPLTALPSPTATYTRLPLSIPSQVIVLPTQPDGSSISVTNSPDVPLLPPDPGSGEEDPIVPPMGTFDPIIRPTMRAVYATQTALANGAEQSATPDTP